MTQPIGRTRFLAANYSTLQGLKIVPLGLWITFIAIWIDRQDNSSRDLGLPLLLLLVAAALTIFINHYYKRTFGQVTPSREDSRRNIVLSILLAILAYGAFIVDSARWLPFSTYGLLVSIFTLEEYIRLTLRYKDQFFLPYLILSILVTIVSLLPLFTPFKFWNALGIRDSLDGILLIIGILTVITGVFSHFYFLRYLPKSVEAGNE